MIKLSSIILICLFLTGCTWYGVPYCRHKAVYCALVASETYPVRIARGKVFLSKHAQAQAFDNTSWRCLDVDNGFIVFTACPFTEITEYMPVEDYFERFH